MTRVIPRRPTPPLFPTAKPIPSPAALRLIKNETHYVRFDLRAVQEPMPLQVSLQARISGALSVIDSTWWSWDVIPCPQGWTCGGLPEANLWQCWFDEDFKPYCHASASKYCHGYGIRNRHMDVPLQIEMGGAWGTRTEIVITCDPYGSRGLDLAHAELEYYESEDNRANWVFHVNSSYACPERFVPGRIPTKPRPKPPNNAPASAEIHGMVGGDAIRLELKKFSVVDDDVVVGMSQFHRAEFVYSPWHLIKCPDGRDCGTYAHDVANVWKCVGEDYAQCYPVGDRRWGLNLTFRDPDKRHTGIAAQYFGGAEGYRIAIMYYCDRDVDPGDLDFADLGTEVARSGVHSIILDAHTREICQGKDWGKLSGGAVFLILMTAVVMLYVAGGTIAKYLLTGVIEVPNTNLWLQVWQSLSVGVQFLFCCRVPEGGLYEKIKGPGQ
jgi:hypothetical protein